MKMRVVFDRGSVLLLDAPSGFDPRGSGGLLWDGRVGSWRAPAWRYVELVKALARGVVEHSDEVSVAPPALNGWQAIDLRPYQEAALDSWELAGRRGLIVLPTGSGKTRLALGAMARTRLATLCLVPTRLLLEQWLREISSAFSGS